MRRFFLILIIVFLASCSKDAGTKPIPVEFNRGHACHVCGMIIVDFTGSKAQVHYKNKKYDSFCSTLDMFLFYLQPDRPGNIAAIYVNDMGKGLHPPSEPSPDITKRGAAGEIKSPPHSNWIDAEKAFYIYGGDIMGSMGEALVPLSDTKDAEVYIKKHGGRIIRFNDVTMDMLKPK